MAPLTIATRKPTSKPTAKPTLKPTDPQTACLSGIKLDSKIGTLGYAESPIQIVSQNGGTVDIQVKQVWKTSSSTDSVSWLATEFIDASKNEVVCPKKNSVTRGIVNYGSGSVVPSGQYGSTLRAKCTAGVAKINVYVHDGSPPFKTQPTNFTVPAKCNPSSDSGKKIGFYFLVPCQECVGQSPVIMTYKPTAPPTKTPTKGPTNKPTKKPTPSPTSAPTRKPTKPPTNRPTQKPTPKPTHKATSKPTSKPTRKPTKKPTGRPSKQPTKGPTRVPTKAPTKQPTKRPTMSPTKQPTRRPTKAPTKPPTKAPTRRPTKAPTKQPTKTPTRRPTMSPTRQPTRKPTLKPTKAPTRNPTRQPTRKPTVQPTVQPTTKTCPSATLLSTFGTINYSKMPITIVPGSQTGSTVRFTVEQVWKSSSSISWIATSFTDSDLNAVVCPKKNSVTAGLVNYAPGSPGGSYEVKNCNNKSWGTVLTARCTNNVALVDVYVHDGQYNGQPNLSVPSECSPSKDWSKKIGYRFSIPCSC